MEEKVQTKIITATQWLRAILMVPNVLDNYIGLEERIGLPLLIDSGGHE